MQRNTTRKDCKIDLVKYVFKANNDFETFKLDRISEYLN